MMLRSLRVVAAMTAAVGGRRDGGMLRRNQRSTRLGDERMKTQDTSSMNSAPSVMPRSGEITRTATALMIPGPSKAQMPAWPRRPDEPADQRVRRGGGMP